MDASLATRHTQSTLTCNLSVLRSVDERTAGLIECAALPPDVEEVVAHDGSPTYRLRDEAGRWRWFGESGAPRVRAEALSTAFEPGAGNTLLIGVGQGELVSQVLTRLAPHQAVFVVEPNPTNLRLALMLHDWQDALNAGRLVPVCAGDAPPEDALTAALRLRPGHLAPDRILKWPWMTPRDVQSAADAARIATDRVEAERRAEVSRHQTTIRAAAGARRGVLLCTTSLRWETELLVDDLGAELTALGARCESFTPRSPARRHTIAFVRALAQSNPAGLILIDGTRADLGGFIPPDVRVVSWLGPAWTGDRTRPAESEHDRCFVSDPIAGDVFEHLPFGVPRRSAHSPATSTRSVIVLADGAATAASACGIEIDSHVKLWDALTAMLRQDAASRTDANVGDALRGAERSTGIRIRDDAVRQRLVQLGECLLWPTLLREHVLDRLEAAGVAFELRGAGWPDGSRWRPRVAGPPPRSAEELEAIAAGALLIDLNAGPTLDYSHVAAVGDGAVVVVPARAGQSPWTGVMAKGSRPPTWRTADELVKLAIGWRSGVPASTDSATPNSSRRLADVASKLLSVLPGAAPRRDAIGCENP